MKWRAYALVLLGVTRALGGSETDPRPEILRYLFLGNEQFALTLRPNSSHWTQLERSADWSTWRSGVALLMGGATQVSLYVDSVPAGATMQLYRLVARSNVVAGYRARWEGLAAGHYRFTVLRAGPLRSAPTNGLGFLVDRRLQADITVLAGSKSIGNVRDLNRDGAEVHDAKPEDFPAIDELYAELERVSGLGVQRVTVEFDEETGVPRESFFDYRPLNGVRVSYWISGFQVIPPAGRPATDMAHSEVRVDRPQVTGR